MNFGQTRKKLYFDVVLAATHTSQTFACTPFRTGLAGDRYGALLLALEALTGSGNQAAMERNEVAAWFQPTAMPAATAVGFNVVFVGPTVGDNLSTTSLPFMTAGSTVATKAGHSAVFGTAGSLRNFSVKVAKQRAVTAAVSGVLYVQRQHSIEV